MEAARAWSNLSSSRLQIQGGRMESLAQKHCLQHTEGLCGPKVLTPGTSEYEQPSESLLINWVRKMFLCDGCSSSHAPSQYSISLAAFGKNKGEFFSTNLL